MHYKLALLLLLNIQLQCASESHFSHMTEKAAKMEIQRIYIKSRGILSPFQEFKLLTILSQHPKLIDFRWSDDDVILSDHIVVLRMGPRQNYSMFDFEAREKHKVPFCLKLLDRGADINIPLRGNYGENIPPAVKLLCGRFGWEHATGSERKLISSLEERVLKEGIDFEVKDPVTGFTLRDFLSEIEGFEKEKKFLFEKLDTQKKRQDDYTKEWDENACRMIETITPLNRLDTAMIVVLYAKPSYKDIGDALKIRDNFSQEREWNAQKPLSGRLL